MLPTQLSTACTLFRAIDVLQGTTQERCSVRVLLGKPLLRPTEWSLQMLPMGHQTAETLRLMLS